MYEIYCHLRIAKTCKDTLLRLSVYVHTFLFFTALTIPRHQQTNKEFPFLWNSKFLYRICHRCLTFPQHQQTNKEFPFLWNSKLLYRICHRCHIIRSFFTVSATVATSFEASLPYLPPLPHHSLKVCLNIIIPSKTKFRKLCDNLVFPDQKVV